MISGAPDQNVDAAKFHAEEIRRGMQRDECAETKMLTRVRLILRRVLGRRIRPHHHRDSNVRPTANPKIGELLGARQRPAERLAEPGSRGRWFRRRPGG